jgi:hypothetical protein
MSDTQKRLFDFFSIFLPPQEALIAADINGYRDPMLAVKPGMSIADLDLLDEE